MTEETNACDKLQDDEGKNEEVTETCEESNSKEASEVNENSNDFGIADIGINESINSGGGFSSSEKPEKPFTDDLEISGEKTASCDEMQNGPKKRKRGRRGGTRRGFGPQNKSNWNFHQHGGFKSGKHMMQNFQQGGRGGFRKRGARNAANLANLPDGILLVKDRQYTGYHCTYCNCVLSSKSTVKDHVGGIRHQVILEARNQEEKKDDENVPQSESENIKETEDSAISGSILIEDDLPLKSSLEDHLATVSDPIVGLDYITETQKQNEEASFECRLCKVTCDSDDMKVHILGTRHCLMYLKTKEPQKIAELMMKNLKKSERNKEIKKYVEILMNKYGRGTIVVGSSQASATAEAEESKNVAAVKSEQVAEETRKPSKTSGAARRQRKKQRAFFQYKNNQSAAGKSMQSNAFVGTVQHKRGGDGANPPRKRQLRDTSYPWVNPFVPEQISRREATSMTDHLQTGSSFDNQYSGDYNYNTQFYQGEGNEDRVIYPADYSHSSSPLSKDKRFKHREYGNEKDPLKQLPGIDLTNEDEAGVVMNVINSLTERFLQYKLKNVAGPAKEILEKSLKDEGLQHALNILTDENNVRTTDRFSDKSNLLSRDVMDRSRRGSNNNRGIAPIRDTEDKCRRDWNDRNDIASPRNMMDESQCDWNETKANAYSRDTRNQFQYDWDEARDTRSSRDLIDQPRRNWSETRNTKSSKDLIDQSQHDWNEPRDTRPKNLMDQPRLDWSETRNTKSSRDLIDQSRHDWNEPRDTRSKNLTDQPRHDWSETIDTRSSRNLMDQSRHNWSETRDTRSRDLMDQPQHDWGETRDTRSRDVMDQPQSNWSETRDTRFRDMMDQSQSDWDVTRDTRSTRDVVDQPQCDWSETRDTMDHTRREWNETRDTMDHTQRDWNETRDVTSKDIMDQSKHNWNDNRNSSSFQQSQHKWNETRRPAVEVKRNANSSTQPSYSWDESRQTGMMGNINTGSFSQSRQNWNEAGDHLMTRNQNTRSFNQSTVGRSTNSFKMLQSRTQGSTDSSSLRKNIDHPSYVDDLFDKYQKKINAEKSQNVSSMEPDNRSHLTSGFTARSSFVGSSTSSFNRPSSFGQLSAIGSSTKWKYPKF